MNPARLLLLLWTLGGPLAADAPPAPREAWVHLDAADGDIRVAARDGAAAQTLAVWAGRALQTLETAWKVDIPFHRGAPLRIRIDADVDAIHLRESRHPGRYLQELLVPADPEKQHPLRLADALVRAFSHRLLWRYAPDRDSPHARRAPDWWVAGQSPRLLDHGVPGILHAWFRETDGHTTHYPESLRLPRRVDAIPTTFRGQAFLAARHLSQTLPPRRLWTWMAAGESHSPDGWVDLLETGDLRSLHIQWDLWLEAELPRLASEYRLETIALARLETHRDVHPARLGFTGLPPKPLPLEELAEEIDRPGLDNLLSQWMLALQPLSFRQSTDLHQCLTAYLDAGRHLRKAARSRGKRRQRALDTFRQHLETATQRYHDLLFQNKPRNTQAVFRVFPTLSYSP